MRVSNRVDPMLFDHFQSIATSPFIKRMNAVVLE